ncbi:MAG: DUF1178 family protein [Pseudomonadota bacterium]
MIHYALRCTSGHQFDGWFPSSTAFEAQQERGLLTCPECGTNEVERALMSPALGRNTKSEPLITPPAKDGAEENAPAPKDGGGSSVPATAESHMAANVALGKQADPRLREALVALRKAVMANGTDVGKAFPEEARRIHYGESEPRSIFGQADLDEAKALIDEGIEVLPLPALPEDQN